MYNHTYSVLVDWKEESLAPYRAQIVFLSAANSRKRVEQFVSSTQKCFFCASFKLQRGSHAWKACNIEGKLEKLSCQNRMSPRRHKLARGHSLVIYFPFHMCFRKSSHTHTTFGSREASSHENSLNSVPSFKSARYTSSQHTTSSIATESDERRHCMVCKFVWSQCNTNKKLT